MKLSSFVVDQIYQLLSSVSVKKYKDCKKTTDNPDQYIVVNSLPVNGGRVQRCFMNVNCHVKDIAEGVPNRAKLDEMATAILALIEKKTTSTLLIDVDRQELIREEQLGEHYMNLRFSVRIRNI